MKRGAVACGVLWCCLNIGDVQGVGPAPLAAPSPTQPTALSPASFSTPAAGDQGADPSRYSHPRAPLARWEIAGGEVRYSADGGMSWRTVLKRAGLLCITGDPLRPQRVYFASTQTTYVTDDAQHVRPLGGPREGGRLFVDRLGRVYVAAHLGQRPGCWRYADGAWDRLLDEPVSDVRADGTDPRRLTATLPAGSGVRTWRSDDDGLSWSRPLLLGEAADTPTVRRYTLTGADADYAANPQLHSPLIVFTNGAMSRGEEVPSGWTLSGEVSLSRDTQHYRSAPASLRAVSTGEGIVWQRVTAPGPTRVRVGGFWVIKGDGEAQLAVQALDDQDRQIAWQPLAASVGAANWSAVGGEFQLPEGTVSFAIALSLRGRQTVWLDDVSLELFMDGRWVPAARVLDRESGRPGDPVDASKMPVTAVPGYFPHFPRGWADWHERLVQRPRLDTNILFIGDELTEQWRLHKSQWDVFARRGADNYGISGDRTQNILWRLNHGALVSVRPSLIILMVGRNNLLDERVAPADVAAGVKAVVQRLRQLRPEARVLVQSILPSQRDPADPLRERTREANALLAKLDDGQSVRYVDVGARVLDAGGELSETLSADGVHLTEAAYTRWAGVLQPLVEDLLTTPSHAVTRTSR